VKLFDVISMKLNIKRKNLGKSLTKDLKKNLEKNLKKAWRLVTVTSYLCWRLYFLSFGLSYGLVCPHEN